MVLWWRYTLLAIVLCFQITILPTHIVVYYVKGTYIIFEHIVLWFMVSHIEYYVNARSISLPACYYDNTVSSHMAVFMLYRHKASKNILMCPSCVNKNRCLLQ